MQCAIGSGPGRSSLPKIVYYNFFVLFLTLIGAFKSFAFEFRAAMAHQSLRRSFFDQQQCQQLKQLWLIIEWAPESRSDGDVYGLISSDDLSVRFQLKELHTGKKVEVFIGEITKRGSIVIVSSKCFDFFCNGSSSWFDFGWLCFVFAPF